MTPQELTVKLNPAKKDPIDFRDYDARKVMGASSETIPRKYFVTDDIEKEIKVEAQNGSGSCVGQAWSKYAEIINWYDVEQVVDLSARFIYSQIHLPEGGSYLRRGGKLIKEKGDSLEELCPSYPATEKAMRKEPDEEAFKNALTYQAKSYAKDWNQDDINFMARMIYENKGFVTGAIMSSEGWQDAHVRPPKDDEDTGGHAVYCYGYDLDEGKIYFFNSWGKDWGNDGKGYFTEDYINSGDLFNIWTLVDKPNTMNPLDQKLNKETIQELYKVIHRRAADEEGVDYWEGKTLRQFIDGVKESKEFEFSSRLIKIMKDIEAWARESEFVKSTPDREEFFFERDENEDWLFPFNG